MIETITSSANHRPPLIPPGSDLYKPLFFPNSDRKFRIFINFMTVGLFSYSVLFMDFGNREHCFSPIRRYIFGKINSLFSINTEDEDYINKRVEDMKIKITQVDEARKKYENP